MTFNPRHAWITSAALIALITLLHTTTGMHHVAFHNLFRRVYYVPIVIAAFGDGRRGGLLAALLVCAAYSPHAFFMSHRDPSPAVDKLLEMVLYVSIGLLTGWFVDQRDRAQRRLQAALEERDALESQLVRAGKLSALGGLTAGLAHELRNPLASILGASEALTRDIPADDRRHRIGEVLLGEVARLDRVITSFLNFARPSTPERRPTELGRLAREVCRLHRHSAPETPALPPPEDAPTLVAEIDPDQASQVLLNLLLNAAEALAEEPPDDARPRIQLRLQERALGERTYACLGVQDNGPGVPPEHLERIFDPYFTTRSDGTGLGLAISSRIMEAHDGFLDVEREDDTTTFWACFPGHAS